MCSINPLDYAIERLKNKDLCIEIGCYYGGWTQHLSKKFNNVVAFQTPKSKKLNNVGTTDGEFSEEGLRWKELMRKRLPEEYQGRYSFDLLAKQIEDLNNVMTILHHSPPTVPFPYEFDLLTYDISRDPTEQLRHYNWWKNKGKKNSLILMGIYDVKPYDQFQITTEEFLSQIDHKWERISIDERYILIYL